MTDRKYLENFPFETLAFLKKLEKNNNREWFNANREMYEEKFLYPAMAFIEEVGLHLQDINPDFKAIPKIDKSIFRIYRDVRFSKDKNPYKTNLGVYFWEGTGKKMETSGLYFHVDPKSFFLGIGMYNFTKDQLKKYRDVISNPNLAEELSEIIKKLQKKGYQLGGKTFKQTPRGYDKESKYSDLLLHSGLYMFTETKDADLFRTKDPVKYMVKCFKELRRLHDWLFVELSLTP